jgi:hypothetical protein
MRSVLLLSLNALHSVCVEGLKRLRQIRVLPFLSAVLHLVN